MDFSYYKNFIVIVETGSISAAAKKLNLAQSALSTQVKRIEEDYGAKLLRMGRGQRTLELTEAGRVFFKQAKYLCSVDDTTRTEINNCAAGLSGTLKISVSPALGSLFHQIISAGLLQTLSADSISNLRGACRRTS
jgi:DNA-binding transcriptional LysR family regulator